uniref:Titin n=1 Tax=Astyanax mexicanus TaxID=7994 RepID=A0A3B1JVG7_ASTMX
MKDGVTVKAGDTIVITASSILGKPPPTAVWSKAGREFKPSDTVQITNTPTTSTLSIKYASRKNTGEYTITASNPFGIKEEKVKVKVLDIPGPPGPIEASSVSAEKCTLTWLPPEEDGGCAIKSYTLEKRETSRLLWTKLAENIMDCRYVASKLIKDPPGPPSNPRISDTTKTTATFNWGRPFYDGGLTITGYTVEYKKDGDDDWVLATATPLRINELVIPNLQAGGKYNFRVSAINSEGCGEPAEIEKIVELVDREELPDFELDAELRRTLVVRSGGSIRLFVPIKGRPTPEVTWTKEDVPLKGRAHIDTTESYTLVVIPECTRYDAGKYVLTLENVAGKRTGFVNVRDTATLAWTKPKHDGGSRITGYVIEAQKKDSDQWVHVTTIKALDYTAPDLTENMEYTFRVFAVNSSGRSEPRESRPAVIREQTTAPGFDLRSVYQQVVVAKAGDNVKVEIPVLGRPRPSVVWKKEDQEIKQTQRINIEDTECIVSVPRLIKGNEYIFRVRGVNKYGVGDPLESEPVVARNSFGKKFFIFRHCSLMTLLFSMNLL